MFFNCMLGFTLPCPFLLECNDIFFLDSAFIGGVLPELCLFVLFLLFHRIQAIPPTHPHIPIRDFLFPVPIVDSPRVLDCLLSLHRDISCFFPTSVSFGSYLPPGVLVSMWLPGLQWHPLGDGLTISPVSPLCGWWPDLLGSSSHCAFPCVLIPFDFTVS